MSSWSRVRLDDLSARVDYGLTASATADKLGPKFLRITDIQDGNVDWDTVPYCSCGTDDVSRYALSEGDIVFARTGATTGKSYLIRECPPNTVFASYLIRIRPNARVDPRYLIYFFDTPDYWGQVALRAQGAGQPGINASKLKELSVPLPPLMEQKRIAAILDQADALRAKRRQAAAVADELVLATFLDMFGDPVTNSRGWPKVTMEELGEVTTGNTPSRKVKEYFGEAVEWIKSDNINTPSHFLTRSSEGLSEVGGAVARIARAGSTLVTCIAGSPSCIGNAALANRDVAFNQQINAITPRQGVDRYFLYGLILASKRLIQEASTDSMKGMVSKSAFCRIRAIQPPADLQAEFGTRFLAIVNMERLQIKCATETEALFASLLQRAFTGKL